VLQKFHSNVHFFFSSPPPIFSFCFSSRLNNLQKKKQLTNNFLAMRQLKNRENFPVFLFEGFDLVTKKKNIDTSKFMRMSQTFFL